MIKQWIGKPQTGRDIKIQVSDKGFVWGIWDFPGGLVVKNPPYNAGEAGLIPGRGTKIPHAARQLSPRATTTELTHLN